mgnify:CR=1 FL=1|tara:strand:+ start:187 stop:573 length:387 start_codon:yes stop_codon:yes gene_type:complete
MGNFISTNINKIDAINLQSFINNNNYLIINTLCENDQHCLISNTIKANEEVEIINKYIKSNKLINIIIYGKNSHDDKIVKKYIQLNSIGFSNLYIYMGGLFEWLLLQQVYGDEEFSTTNKCDDILKYK